MGSVLGINAGWGEFRHAIRNVATGATVLAVLVEVIFYLLVMVLLELS